MKSDQRVVLTKRLLQEGLFHLLETKRIDEIRVSELCAVSGVNRATFYRHYAQPRDILRDTRRQLIREVQAIAGAEMIQADLHRWLEELCRYLYRQRAVLRVLFQTRTDDEFAELISELCSDQLYQFHGRLTPEQDADSRRLTAYGYAGGFYYILRQWLLEPVDKTPEEIAAVMYRFLTGI